MQNKSFVVGLLSLAVGVGGSSQAGHADSVSSMTLVWPWEAQSDPEAMPVGWAKLVRTEAGATVTIKTSGIPAGHAITIWAVVFNDPTMCTGDFGIAPTNCGADDLEDPDVMADIVFLTGHVVGASGNARFGGHLEVGEPGVVTGLGLLDPFGADIHFIVRDHGPALPGEVAEQISTVMGGCNVNVCSNIQFGIFIP